MPVLKCDQCGEPFDRSVGQINTNLRRGKRRAFCSSRCAVRFMRESPERKAISAGVARKHMRWAPRHEDDRVKASARAKVADALADGRLVKPSICDDCGQGCDDIVGHHENYHRPYDVDWLCGSCHAKRHTGQKTHSPPRRRVADRLPAARPVSAYEKIEHLRGMERIIAMRQILSSRG